jgi:phosphatidylglycerol lysyltransferase
MMGDPVTGGHCTPDAFTRLAKEARRDFAGLAAYKISARSAAVARRAGWHVFRLSEEAVLRPATFSVAGSKFRQLRRKLSQAKRAGITVTRPGSLPLAQMAAVAKDWVARSGGERGFSMGMFDREHIEKQRCYLAWQGTELVAFVTFHTNDFEWGLDLMRSKTGTPDGAMHALVCAALEDAKSLGINRLSLAAMATANPHVILKKLGARNGAAGLRQFKLSFRPDAKPLYLAAPNPVTLATSALDIALRIRFPDRPAVLERHEDRHVVYA